MNSTLALCSMDMNIVTSIEFSHSLEAMRAHDEYKILLSKDLTTAVSNKVDKFTS